MPEHADYVAGQPPSPDALLVARIVALEEALAWLVKYRDTTVIPPDNVAATLRQARLSPVRGVPSDG
jgi:hypothetical protein